MMMLHIDELRFIVLLVKFLFNDLWLGLSHFWLNQVNLIDIGDLGWRIAIQAFLYFWWI